MPARIDVVLGPDTGRRFLVHAGEARIGCGTGHQVRLRDPSWGAGCLLVQHRQAGFLVTNHMPHSVVLDGEVLARGETKTWYAEACLQPSKATVLRLEVVSQEQAPADGAGVAELAPEKQTSGKRDALWLTVIFVGTLLFVLLLSG